MIDIISLDNIIYPFTTTIMEQEIMEELGLTPSVPEIEGFDCLIGEEVVVKRFQSYEAGNTIALAAPSKRSAYVAASTVCQLQLPPPPKT